MSMGGYMRFTKILTVGALILACCGDPTWARPISVAEQRAVEASVKERLKDPESARFRHPNVNVPVGSIGAIYCGRVNSKNGYGGYAGDAEFAAIFGTSIKRGKPSVTGELLELGDADPSSEDSQVVRKICAKYGY